MSFLKRWIGAAVIDAMEARSTVNTTHPRDPVLAEWFGGGGDASVTANTALGIPAVQACVNLLAETIGALPLGVKRTEKTKVVDAQDHPLHNLLTSRPCPFMTSVEWVEWLVACTALRGDAFAEIVQDQRGNVQQLPPIPFTAVKIERAEKLRDGLRFKVNGEGGERTVLADEMLRIPWKIQADGSSLSPIAIQREAFATSLAARRYQKQLLNNNASPKGGLVVPTTLSDEAVEALVSSWEKRHKGPENAGRLAVFDGGLTWQNIGMSNEDAQFAELLQMSLRDVARVFRVQPHKIGDLEKATFSNIEHQSIEFVTDTVLPWVRRLEARMSGWLLSDKDRLTHSIEFNLRGLLRGDAGARAELYKALFYAGAMSPNEIRRLEGMNPIDGGDRFYVQGATVPVDLIDEISRGNTPAGTQPIN